MQREIMDVRGVDSRPQRSSYTQRSSHAPVYLAKNAAPRSVFLIALAVAISFFTLACGEEDKIIDGAPDVVVDVAALPDSTDKSDGAAVDVAQTNTVQFDVTPSDVVESDVVLGDGAAVSPDVIDAADAPGACQASEDCSGTKPQCDTAAGVCVACLLDDQCAKGERCLAQSCAKPTTCKSDKTCVSIDGVCDKSAGICVDCSADVDCTDGYICRQRHCLAKPKLCVSSKTCFALGAVCDKKKGYCVDCIDDADCTTTQFCAAGLCLVDICAKGDATCKSPSARNVCADNGSGWVAEDCATGTACDAGSCKKIICTPDTKRCEPIKPGDKPGNGAAAGQKAGVQLCDKRGISWGTASACASKETCVDGACLPQTCAPGEQRCAAASVQTCDNTGLAWAESACTAKQACVEAAAKGAQTATCVAKICVPGALVCDGNTVATCGKKGLKKLAKLDCSQLPDSAADAKAGATVAGVCVAGACQVKSCVTGSKTCGATAVLTCTKGSWQAKACGDKETCSAGSCAAVSCVANETWCDLAVVKTCNAKGDDATWVEDCQAQGKRCKAGGCVPYVCKPGNTGCSLDSSAARTCKVDGSGWVDVPCGTAQTCVQGACKKVVCEAGKSFCDGEVVKQCNASGTQATKTATCGAGKACLLGACVKQICTPADSRCAKGGSGSSGSGGTSTVQTCAGNGLSWSSSPCPGGQACAAGDCKKVICKAGASFCKGADVMQCDPTGTAAKVAATCAQGKICSDGACLTKLCNAGTTRCGTGANAGTLQTCAADGLSYVTTTCKAGSACGTDSCQPVICTVGAKSCMGTTPSMKPQVCAAAGTKLVPAAECKAGQGTAGQVCSAGVCIAAVCAPSDRKCDGLSKQLTCSSTLLAWTSTTCGSGTACNGGDCKTVVCVAKSAFCSGAEVRTCDATGTASVKKSTCSAGTICVGGACKKLVCKPGNTVCGVGDAATKLRTCAADGLSWVEASCGVGKTCDSGACKPLICTAKVLSCVGKKVVKCNNLGTATVKVTTCPADKGCLFGVCTAKVCVPKSVSCAADKLRTCNADGTAFTDESCGFASICKNNTCVKKVCNPASKYCSGSRIVACTADGTSWESKIDCTLSKATCVAGVCKPWVCTAGELACKGAQLGTCAADGLSWKTATCSDNNACTADSCAAGKCVNGASKTCNDGDPCTGDSCDKTSGKCVTTPISGSCDDGSVCTQGEVCTGGKCLAPTTGQVQTYAGTGVASVRNGPRAQARFNRPWGVAWAPDGTLFVSDYRSHVIRKITPAGQVSTFAGTSGARGSNNGSPGRFSYPTGLAYDGKGGVYVADRGNHQIRHVSAAGQVTTIATAIGSVSDVTVGQGGVLFAAAQADAVIQRIDPITKAKTIMAGRLKEKGSNDGPVATARLSSPSSMALGLDGRLYIADAGNTRIRLLHQGAVITLAGSTRGYRDGAGSQALFRSPTLLRPDGRGGIFVLDSGDHRLRRVTVLGKVTTVAFSGVRGMTDGASTTARIYAPYGMAVTSTGQIYITDYGNNRVRLLAPASIDCDDGKPCTTDACNPKTGACSHIALSAGAACDDQNPCIEKEVCVAGGSCKGVAKSCSDGKSCTADSCDLLSGSCSNPPRVGSCTNGDACSLADGCKNGSCVTGLGQIETVVGSGGKGLIDGAAKTAQLNAPIDISVDAAGTVWWVENGSHTLRRMAADGKVVTVAGGNGYGFADGLGSDAKFNGPQSLVAAKGGAVFVADVNNRRIRRLSPGGWLGTYAGTGTHGYLDGPAAQAKLGAVYGLAIKRDGTLVFSDASFHRIRTVSTKAVVNTLAGSGTAGYLDGPGSSARFSAPRGVAVAPDGSIYVADTNNYRLRKVASNGQVTTVAGVLPRGFQDGAVTSARFGAIWHVAVMADGGVVVADYGNQRIRRILGSTVTTLIGGGAFKDGGLDAAKITNPVYGLTVAPNGDVWLAGYKSQRLRRMRFGKRDCNDNNPCTSDACDKSKGCVHKTINVGKPCDDGDACTTATTCGVDGSCVGTTKNCNDGNVCTTDSCHPYLGTCSNEANRLSCDDGSKCTADESCYAKSCTAELPVLTTLAGSSAGYADGKGSAARFNTPFGLVRVGADLWVSDYANHRIRKIATDGTVSTIVGSGSPGLVDGKGTKARLYYPQGLAVAPDGSVLVVDSRNHRIRRITADLTVTTYTNGGAGFLDGDRASAKFKYPTALTIDKTGQVAISDTANQRIRLITLAGKVITFAGSGVAGFADGPGSSARFKNPSGIDFDGQGNLYVADTNNHRLRMISPTGVVSTVGGTGAGNTLQLGLASSAILPNPYGLHVAVSGVIYFTSASADRVLQFSNGVVSSLFGGATAGITDGVLAKATLKRPRFVTTDHHGQLYISDTGNHRIRTMLFAQVDCDDGSPCTTDSCDAKTGKCSNNPAITGSKCSDGNGCTVKDSCTAQGKCGGTVNTCNDSNVCTTDSCHTLTGACSNVANTVGCDDGDACTTGETCFDTTCQNDVGLVTTLAGSSAGFIDGSGATVRFNVPYDISQDSAGMFYVADRGSHRIRRVTTAGKVTLLAGTGSAGYVDGAGTSAKFNLPSTLLVRNDGSLVVYEGGARLRTVVISGAAIGTVGTAAGSGSPGLVDGYATSAKFGGVPGGMAEDSAGLLYIADVSNHRIRTLNKAKNVATFVGSSTGFADGGVSTARFNNPQDVAVSADGTLYIADTGNRRIRRVAGGVVTTIAGSGALGSANGAALLATFAVPTTVDRDALGRIFVADMGTSQRIRRVFGGKVTTVAGSGQRKSVDGFGVSASLYSPRGAVLGVDGHYYFVEMSSHRVRRLLMPKKICVDDKVCTVDSCNKTSGTCSFAVIGAGGSCSDPSKPCISGSTCTAGGLCQGGGPKSCDDKDACTVDGCDAKKGCVYKPVIGATCQLFVGSKVLFQADELKLNQWYGAAKQGWKLCFQGSRDGFYASKFHQFCNAGGPTYTVIQTSTGRVFGGYTTQSWSGTGFRPDASAFLYSLDRGAKYPVINSKYAMYRRSTYGPTFGSGHDLAVTTTTLNTGYSRLGSAYSCPAGSYKLPECEAWLAGSKSFAVKEIEVFMKQ